MSAPGLNGKPGDAVQLGLVCGVAACVLWGLFPIYFRLLDGVGAAEIVAQRILWSVPFGALVLTLRRQWRETLLGVKSQRVLMMLAVSAFFISLNWLTYVWSVVNERIIEASLGYYINPLTFIAAGVLVLKERLNMAQAVAVALAAIGVLVLTVGAGVFPWPALILAFSFTVYGYVRKTVPVGAMPGLFLETVLLSPLALAFVFWLHTTGALAFTHQGARTAFWLALAGPVTVVPLVLFALAARRLQLTTIGFLQYIAPTGQLLLGLYYGEAFTLYHAVCFGLIWTALALISVDALRRGHSDRKARIALDQAAAISKS